MRLGSFDQIRGIIDEELEAVWAGDKSAQEAARKGKKGAGKKGAGNKGGEKRGKKKSGAARSGMRRRR